MISGRATKKSMLMEAKTRPYCIIDGRDAGRDVPIQYSSLQIRVHEIQIPSL